MRRSFFSDDDYRFNYADPGFDDVYQKISENNYKNSIIDKDSIILSNFNNPMRSVLRNNNKLYNNIKVNNPIENIFDKKYILELEKKNRIIILFLLVLIIVVIIQYANYYVVFAQHNIKNLI